MSWNMLTTPVRLLRSAARALRDPSSVISVLVRNQAGEVLKAAILDGDLAAAESNLTAEWDTSRCTEERCGCSPRGASKPCCSNRHLR